MSHDSSIRPKRPYHFHIAREYLHEIRAKAGQMGGLAGGRKGGLVGGPIGGPIGGKKSRGGGRPKGTTIAPGEKRINYAITQSTRDTFNKCANYEGMTTTAFMHMVAEAFRSDPTYAHLFAKPNAQPAPPTDQQ